MTHERPLPKADEFISVLKDMKRHDMYFYTTGVFSFKSLFDGFILENRINEAQDLFKQLAKHELCQLDTVLYNTIMKTLCSHPFYNSNASLASKMMDDALKLVREMLRAYCKAYKVDEAMLLYLEMNERGFKPDHETYSIMISMLFNVARSRDALKVLDDMRAQGQMLNAFTYFCILNDLLKMGHLEEALSLFHFVGDDGKLNSKISVYHFLINAAFNYKKPHIATELFEDLTVKGMKPDLDLYTDMVAGFCGEGLMKDAKNLFLKMEESGIPPVDLTYNSLIQLYLKSKCYDDVKTLLHKMAKTDHCLDELTYAWLQDSVAAGMLDSTTLELIN